METELLVIAETKAATTLESATIPEHQPTTIPIQSSTTPSASVRESCERRSIVLFTFQIFTTTAVQETYSTSEEEDALDSATTEINQILTSVIPEIIGSQPDPYDDDDKITWTTQSSTIRSSATAIPVTLATSTKPSTRSNHIFLFIAGGVLLLLICTLVIALAASHLCYYGKWKRAFTDQVDPTSEGINTEANDSTKLGSQQPSASSVTSQTPSSAISTQHNESRFFMKPTNSYVHKFEDDSF